MDSGGAFICDVSTLRFCTCGLLKSSGDSGQSYSEHNQNVTSRTVKHWDKIHNFCIYPKDIAFLDSLLEMRVVMRKYP